MARPKKVVYSGAEVSTTTTTIPITKPARTPSPSGTRLPSSPESERPIGPLSVVSSQHLDIIKVNNANATELKNACDDAVKRVRSSLYIYIYISLFLR